MRSSPDSDPAEDAGNLRTLTPDGLAALGNPHVAYIAPATVNGEDVFVLHGADGRPLAVVPDHASALHLARQNDLEVYSLH